MFSRRKKETSSDDAVTNLMEKTLDLDRQLEKQARSIDGRGGTKAIHFETNDDSNRYNQPVSPGSRLSRFSSRLGSDSSSKRNSKSSEDETADQEFQDAAERMKMRSSSRASRINDSHSNAMTHEHGRTSIDSADRRERGLASNNVSALDRFRAAQNASKIQHTPSIPTVTEHTVSASQDIDDTAIRATLPTKASDKVSDAGASYGKAGALLDRLMGKSKLQQAAYGDEEDDDAKNYEDEIHAALNRQEGENDQSAKTSIKTSTISRKFSRHRESRTKGAKRISNFIASWPYDDYENDYDALMSVASIPVTGNNYQDDDEDFNGEIGAYKGDVLVRPSELPTIKIAVKNLPLTQFEEVAEKRATAIISTWIYDSGLIDELLVSGSRSVNVLTPTYVSSDKSIKSHEGIELGGAMQKVPSDLKMEREIDRLRRATEQELSFVNTRLNDGVASSGEEVQELVQAVTETRGEISHLRKMFSYISKGGDAKEGDFLLADYPKLRCAIHARKNLFRCFRDLEFFANIPSTCTRLREELSSAEYTPHEYITIRKVSMEHVDLEVMMVEADAGLRGKVGASGQGTEVVMGEKEVKSNASDQNPHLKEVDAFLSGHQKNVASLGKEIRERVLAAIGSAYEMSLENPSGLVALVEAIETYEAAADEYAKKPDFDVKYGVRFTKMRKDALKTLHNNFKKRCVDVFSNIQMLAADLAADEQEEAQFVSVLKGATELLSEMETVRYETAPCFPSEWAIDALWASSVSNICCNNLLQQIGGQEGNNLCLLSVSQLIDLVCWIEYFKEQMCAFFPQIIKRISKTNTLYETMPDLFVSTESHINLDVAIDGIAWSVSMLIGVHEKVHGEFLQRVKQQTDDFLANVYRANHSSFKSNDGTLVSSLPEDVFSLIGVQIRTMRDSLSSGSESSDAFVLAVSQIFSRLRSRQIQSRNRFLGDFEACCAAANDFIRLGENCEEVMSDILSNVKLEEKSQEMLDNCLSEVLSLYSLDAMYSAQCCHLYVFEPIVEAIASNLFSFEWETRMTSNQYAVTLVKTVEDFIGDLEEYLDKILYVKALTALVPATIVFYVNCIVAKSNKHNNSRKGAFENPEIALARMLGDIRVMREFFEGLASKHHVLSKFIKKEFASLMVIHECLCCAAHTSTSKPTDAILGLHTHIGDVHLTKRLAGDLWHLVSPSDERQIWELMENDDFLEVAPEFPPDTKRTAKDRASVPGLRLDILLVRIYRESSRQPPCKDATSEAFRKSLDKWAVGLSIDDFAHTDD